MILSEPTDPRHAWLYLRKTRDETNDPHLFDRHRALLLRTFAADGIDVPAANIFEEVGTAEWIESRPAFQRLLEIWARLPYHAGGVVGVVEISRLSRGTFSQQGRVQDALVRAGIRIRTPGGHYDLTRFEDRFSLNAQGLVANAEHELFKQRIRRAWDEMLRRGEIRNGQAPWGYRWSKDEENLLLHPLRFPLLVTACQQVFTRSVKRLAADFGVPETTLLAALRNPTICGWPAIRFGPTGNLDPGGRSEYVRLPRALWRWPEQQNEAYPHACTRGEWEAIQQALDERRTRRGKLTGQGWCRDVVRFVEHPVPARCGSYAVPGRYRLLYEVLPPGRPKLYIDRESVHVAAEAALARLCDQPLLIREALAVQARATEAAAAITLSVSDLQAEQERHERHLVQLLERELDADSPGELRRIAILRAEKEAAVERLARQIETLREEGGGMDPGMTLLRTLTEPVVPFAAWWPEVAEEDRRLIVRSIFAAIEVTVTPEWRTHRREVTAVRYQPRWSAWLGDLHG